MADVEKAKILNNPFWNPREDFGVGFASAGFTRLGKFLIEAVLLVSVAGGGYAFLKD